MEVKHRITSEVRWQGLIRSSDCESSSDSVQLSSTEWASMIKRSLPFLVHTTLVYVQSQSICMEADSESSDVILIAQASKELGSSTLLVSAINSTLPPLFTL